VTAPSPDDVLVLRSRIPADAHGEALLDYLARRFPYHDRERWRRELADRRVLLAGAVAAPDARVRGGSELAYHKLHREPWVERRIDVLHDDDAVLVVDKPAHLPMHADGPFVRNTLVHLLRERCAAPALSLVHRLDRETSGVCVLARDDAARAALHAQFERGDVAKVYVAVVRGVVAHDFTVDAPIGRARRSEITLRRATGDAAEHAQPATTHFRVLAHGPAATLLRCEPRSGRTHQIRVHLESAGHPVLGDKLYGEPDAHYLAFVRAVKRTGDAREVAGHGPDRHLLHASELTVQHPRTGATVHWTAPVPPEFERWLREAPGADRP
jgi:RluA family pseudouridine synthase